MKSLSKGRTNLKRFTVIALIIIILLSMKLVFSLPVLDVDVSTTPVILELNYSTLQCFRQFDEESMLFNNQIECSRNFYSSSFRAYYSSETEIIAIDCFMDGILTKRYFYNAGDYNKIVISYQDGNEVLRTFFEENRIVKKDYINENHLVYYRLIFEYMPLENNFQDQEQNNPEMYLFQQIILEIESDNSFLSMKTVYEYDRNGNTIKELQFGMLGTLIYEKRFNYNNQGNLVGEITYNHLQMPTSRKLFSYDAFGRLTRESWFSNYDGQGWQFLYAYEYEYFENGDMSRITISYPDYTFSSMYYDRTLNIWLWDHSNEESYWQY